MRILFIGNQDIFGKLNKGGIQCSRRNYDLLSSNNEVYAALLYGKDFVRVQNEKVRYFEMLQSNLKVLIAALGLRKWYTKKTQKEIIKYILEIKPDIVYIDNSIMAELVRFIPAEIKTVVFFHNIESDYAWNKVKEEGWWFLPSYFASRYNESVAVKKASKLICLNKRDGERLNEVYGRNPDYYLPISFSDCFDESKICRECNKKELLFVGSLFPPNYHGIKWFIEEVMTKLTDYHLTVVGRDFETKKEELERENVSVVGTVDDLDSFYYSNAALVMPIQYGAGMKVKTAEAMMYGVSIFATNEALEGYDVDNTEGIYRCNTVEEFVDAIKEAFTNNKIQRYMPEVRDVYLSNHETQRQNESFSAFINSVK